MRYAFYTSEPVDEKWDEAWGGDSVGRHLRTTSMFPQLVSLFERHLESRSDILEAGCGLGRWLIFLRNKGCDPVGIDYSKNALMAVRDYDESLPTNLGDVTDLPYKDDTFDIYISFGVIEHVEHNREEILREAYRVLRPNGIAIVSVPLLNNLSRMLWFVNKIRFGTAPERHFFEEAMSERTLASLLEQTGFEVIDSAVYGQFTTLYSLFPFLRKDMSREAAHLSEFNILGEKLNTFFTDMDQNTFISRQTAHMITCVGSSRKGGV
ncbi:MAG: methyltransferase domain-containing protein [Methanobacteriota archaeon]|nr:MAG: methyltransferase domain-containing protein [Euryarchaeota archaeon]